MASKVFAMPSALLLVFERFLNAAPQEDVENLADAVDADAAFSQAVEQHSGRWWHRVIVTVGGAREVAGRADERARDPASHLGRATQNVARRLADLVLFPQRDHFFVGGHLEDAVGRGVHNRRARPHVFRAQFLNDFRA